MYQRQWYIIVIAPTHRIYGRKQKTSKNKKKHAPVLRWLSKLSHVSQGSSAPNAVLLQDVRIRRPTKRDQSSIKVSVSTNTRRLFKTVKRERSHTHWCTDTPELYRPIIFVEQHKLRTYLLHLNGQFSTKFFIQSF